MATTLEETSDALLGHFVDRCRRGGHSWTEISAALGVTKQAAHKRFSLAAGPSLDLFTPRARTAMTAASGWARNLRHDYVGTEHLLLGLFDPADSIASKVLRGQGVTRKKVEKRLLAFTPRGDAEVVDDPPFTPRAADALGAARHEALQLGHNYVGTEHVLLALFRDPDSLAARLLDELGLDAQTVKAEVVKALGSYRRG